MFEDLSHKGWFLYLCCLSIITFAGNHCAVLSSVVVITLTCLARDPSSIPQHGANLEFPLHISLLNMVKWGPSSTANRGVRVSSEDIKLIGKIETFRVDFHLNALMFITLQNFPPVQMPHTTLIKPVFSELEFKFIGYCKLPIRLTLQGHTLKRMILTV